MNYKVIYDIKNIVQKIEKLNELIGEYKIKLEWYQKEIGEKEESIIQLKDELNKICNEYGINIDSLL